MTPSKKKGGDWGNKMNTSVCITVFNEEVSITTLLDSLLRQTKTRELNCLFINAKEQKGETWVLKLQNTT